MAPFGGVKINAKCPFQGSNCILSNMYPCLIFKYGMKFNSSEQLYQYEKASFHGMHDMSNKILQVFSGFAAKDLAKRINVSPSWHNIKYSVMLDIAKLKYQQNFTVSYFLKRHERFYFVETVKGEFYWSCGLSKSEMYSRPMCMWPGLNMMGQIWMRIAKESAKEIDFSHHY